MRAIVATLWVVCATAAAQNNVFEIYSGCTNFTSRGTLGAAAGDILVKVPQMPFRGIAHDATGLGTRLTGFRFVTQDQNAATQESYDLIIRRDVGGVPGCTPAGALLEVGPFMTPVGVGITAWQLTHVLATPSAVIPVCGEYYFGSGVAANPTWTADGQSFHMSSYYPLMGTQGDNPAAVGAQNLAWDCHLAGFAPVQPASSRCYRIGLLTEAAVLNIGNVDPTMAATHCLFAGGGVSYGVGGVYPQCGGGRSDGLNVRVRDAGNAGGIYVVYAGVALPCPGPPVLLPGFAAGALYLNPAFGLFQVAAGLLAPGTGEGFSVVVPPGWCAVPGTIPMQALTIGPALALPAKLSNGAAAIYLP